MDCCHTQTVHPDYSNELKRLNRIAGKVEGVKKMVQDRRYCPDILIQLRAVRSAINAVEANILSNHLEACVAQAFTSGSEADKKQKMSELKELYLKYGQ